jgi:hypothetical protein
MPGGSSGSGTTSTSVQAQEDAMIDLRCITRMLFEQELAELDEWLKRMSVHTSVKTSIEPTCNADLLERWRIEDLLADWPPSRRSDAQRSVN